MKQVIRSPYITEKSMMEASRGWYTFLVDNDSNKFSITQAVETEYKVHVVDIKTINVKAKTKRTGKKRILTAAGKGFKKAMVKLKSGEKIDAFEVGEQKTK